MRFVDSKPFTYFTFLLGAALLLAFLHFRGWLGPVESSAAEIPKPFMYVLSGAGNGIKSFFSYFSDVHQLNVTNAKLKDQIRTLQEQNVTLSQYKVENDILKKELGYRNAADFNLVSANVIGKDISGFSQTITIDTGINAGVEEGDAVVEQGVLIGKVILAQSFSSKVALITDPQSAIDAQIAGTTTNAVLRGSYGSGVVLAQIPQNFDVKTGTSVISAGLTGKIPHGILIGQIGELQTKKNDLLQTASIVPNADLKNLNFLAVIKQ